MNSSVRPVELAGGAADSSARTVVVPTATTRPPGPAPSQAAMVAAGTA